MEAGTVSTLVDLKAAVLALPATRAVALEVVDEVRAAPAVGARAHLALVHVLQAAGAHEASVALTAVVIAEIYAVAVLPARIASTVVLVVLALRAAVAGLAHTTVAGELVNALAAWWGETDRA